MERTHLIEVLEHTSLNGRYVTDEAQVIAMATAGFLKDHGPQRLADGMHYFTMTEAGRAHLNEYRTSLPKPKPLTRSQQRYRDFLRMDGVFESFGDFLAYTEARRKGILQ